MILFFFLYIKNRNTILFSSDLYYSKFCIVCYGERERERERERENNHLYFGRECETNKKNYIKEDEQKNIQNKMYSCKYQIIQVMLCNKITSNHSVIS